MQYFIGAKEKSGILKLSHYCIFIVAYVTE